MRNVTVAAVQMKCSKSVEKNIAHAEELVRQAAAKGAEIVLLPELFERPYFCQERRYEYYEYAQTAEENPAVRHFSRVAAACPCIHLLQCSMLSHSRMGSLPMAVG